MYIADWNTLVEKGELDTLKIPELGKYIEHNKLSKNGKKIDKIKRITVYYYETSKDSTFPSSVTVLVRTVMRVTVTMTLFCVMKVKAKVNQMMTVIL